MAEATAVSPEGRISHGDTGIWNEEQVRAFLPITTFIKNHGAAAAIQLAHAGRKASVEIPWLGGKPLLSGPNSWSVVAPSALAYNQNSPVPHELSTNEISDIVKKFVKSTQLSLQAGFDVIELHMAHGYLMHQFLSPLSNHRRDEYGGSLENRMRFPLEVARETRKVWPADRPLFVRISATDWVDGGWNLEDSLNFCGKLKSIGVDLIDCSTGGLSPLQKLEVSPGYQVPFADAVRHHTGILTGAVGLITNASQAESILKDQKADVVFLARELLRDPYWPLHAAHELGTETQWPNQYLRAKPH